MNIREIAIKFKTDDECLAYIEQMRWPDGIVRCTVCGDKNVEKYERPTTTPKPRKNRTTVRDEKKTNRRAWFYVCRNVDCRNQFSPTSGTLFADTHLPLIVWFHAVGLVLNAKKGISAKQLQRDLGIGGYKTAWYLLHRIRKSMSEANPVPLGGTVEIDEVYLGGKQKGKGVYYGKKQKQTVMGAVQRGGEIRFQHVPNTKQPQIRGFISTHVGADAQNVYTDQSVIYPYALSGDLKARHQTVNHILKEYARGDVFTNTIESAFSLLKRGLIGQYHRLSGKHLHRYLAEFQYRYNRRRDADAFIETVRRICKFPPLRFDELTSD
jgi:transposase-like protein